VGLGTQEIHLGVPLLPEDLSGMPYKDRKELVVAAINATGPANAVEEPFPGDPELAARVEERVARTGVDEPHAVLMEVLAARADLHPASAAVVEGDRKGSLAVGSDPLGQWLGELARRLYGPRGPSVR
jgi:hypothetical protein